MPVHLVINTSAPDLAVLASAIEALRRGEVIAYPTDTLYGLGADPRDAHAVDAVFRIKGRPEAQPVPLIAGDLDQARAVARLNAAAIRLVKAFWPGPLTLILPQEVSLAAGVGLSGTVALRVPDHAVARALALGLGFPIISTSANRTGAPAPATAEEVMRTLGGELSVLVDGGPTAGGAPSTIVDLVTDTPRLLRAGAVPWDRVLESLE